MGVHAEHKFWVTNTCDTPSANPLLNTIAEYFLLKSVVSQKLSLLLFFYFFTKLNIQLRQGILSLAYN